MKVAENAPNRSKMLWEPAISLFPTVFSRLLLQTRKKQGLFGKGLNRPKKLVLSNLKAFAENDSIVAK